MALAARRFSTRSRRGAVLEVALTAGVLLMAACATPSRPPEVKHYLSGQDFPLTAFRGHVTLLNFWATWCKPCLAEVPELAKIADHFGERVMFVAVYYQPESVAQSEVTNWLRIQPEYFAHQVAWGNSALHKLYPHPLLPTTYVVGCGGVVVRKFEGSITSESRIAELRAAIEIGLQQPLPPVSAAVP